MTDRVDRAISRAVDGANVDDIADSLTEADLPTLRKMGRRLMWEAARFERERRERRRSSDESAP